MAHTRLVTCPETRLLQRIEYVTDRDGAVLLVIGCTHFAPSGTIDCAAPCGDALDASARKGCAGRGATRSACG